MNRRTSRFIQWSHKAVHQPTFFINSILLISSYCDYVFQTLADFVYNCLCEAEKNQLSSVAFPSLGTGNLTYPPDRVASIMFETVNRYALSTNLGSLKHVVFVIYSMDAKSLQVRIIFCCVTLTGLQFSPL